jgi:hypothetical protein
MNISGESIFGLLDFKFPTTEFVLAKECQDQSRNGVFFIFMSIYAEEFLWPKKRRKKSLNRVHKFFCFKWVDIGIKKSVILRLFKNGAFYLFI